MTHRGCLDTRLLRLVFDETVNIVSQLLHYFRLPMLAVAVNLAQLAALPIHSRLSLKNVSTVVPAFMKACATTVELCSTLLREEEELAVSTAA